MSTSLSNHFESLHAKLVNNRWSWGAVREDGTVFLRVWQDHRRSINGTTFVRMTNHENYVGRTDNLGYQERLSHVELLENGNSAFFIMCTARDVDERPRNVQSFDRRTLLKAGELKMIAGDQYASIVARVNCSAVR